MLYFVIMENFDPFKNKKVDFITYLKRCHHYILKHYDFESFIVCPYLGLLLTTHLLIYYTYKRPTTYYISLLISKHFLHVLPTIFHNMKVSISLNYLLILMFYNSI